MPRRRRSRPCPWNGSPPSWAPVSPWVCFSSPSPRRAAPPGAEGAHPPRSARGLTLRNPTPCRRPRTEGPRAALGDTFPRKSSRTNRPTPSIRSFRRIPKPSRRERAPPRFRPTVSKLYVSPVVPPRPCLVPIATRGSRIRSSRRPAARACSGERSRQRSAWIPPATMQSIPVWFAASAPEE